MKPWYLAAIAISASLCACGPAPAPESESEESQLVAPETAAPESSETPAPEPAPESVETATPQASSAGGAPPAPALETVFDITAEQAQKLIAFDQNIQVLDIRTPGEFENGSVPGAINIDFRGSDFKEQIAQLDRATPYVVHCASGGRSGSSLELFKELGFQRIYHMTDGFNGWSKLETDSPE